MVYTNDNSGCGIAVPLVLKSRIKCIFSGPRHFGIVIGSWVIISVHLIWGEREAEDTLNEITLEIKNLEDRYYNDNLGVAVCIDANVSLGKYWTSTDIYDRTSQITGNNVVTSNHSVLDQTVFKGFIMSNSLYAAKTWEGTNNSSAITWERKGAETSTSQIDFLLATVSILGRSLVIPQQSGLTAAWSRSNHHPVAGVYHKLDVELPQDEISNYCPSPLFKGSEIANSTAKKQFMISACTKLADDVPWDNLAPSIRELLTSTEHTTITIRKGVATQGIVEEEYRLAKRAIKDDFMVELIRKRLEQGWTRQLEKGSEQEQSDSWLVLARLAQDLI